MFEIRLKPVFIQITVPLAQASGNLTPDETNMRHQNESLLFSLQQCAKSKLIAAKGALIFSIALLFFTLIVLMPFEKNVQAQSDATANPSASPEEKPAKSIVRGKAVYDDTNRPIRRAPIILMSISGRKSDSGGGLTDNNGNFEIKNLPAGTYIIAVTSPGLMNPFSFMENIESQNDLKMDVIKEFFQEVTVDGKADTKIEVRGKRGGAINGRVTYSDGDPAVNISVSILRKKAGKFDRVVTSLNMFNFFGTRTDDRGIYRVAGLPPGDYYVMASEAAAHDDSSRNSGMDAAFEAMFGNISSMLNTYYPNETSLQNATVLSINAGQEQSDVDISLAERALYKIAGTVVARKDKHPLKGTQVTMSRKDEKIGSSINMERDLNRVSTDEQGNWSFKELPEGTYTIRVTPATEYEEQPEKAQSIEAGTYKEPKPKPRMAAKQQEIKLSGGDVENLTIEISEGSIISGKVTVVGNKPLKTSVTVTAQKVMPESSANDETDDSSDKTGSSYIYPEGNNEFKIEGLSAGPVYVDASVDNNMRYGGGQANNKYYIKSIRAGGLDLLNSALNITEGAEVKNIQVVLGDDAATLKGRVQQAGNVPASGAIVWLVPTDFKWRGTASLNRLPIDSADMQGEVNLTAAPGEYFVVILKSGESGNASNSWLQAKTANAQRILLSPNENKIMTLIVASTTNTSVTQ